MYAAYQISTIKSLLAQRYESIQSLCLFRFLRPYAFPWAWDYYIALREPKCYRFCKLVMQCSFIPFCPRLVSFLSSEPIVTSDDLFVALQVNHYLQTILGMPSSSWYVLGENHLVIETPKIKKHWVWQDERNSRIMTEDMAAFLWKFQTKVIEAFGEQGT
jgi:hypothetical protein